MKSFFMALTASRSATAESLDALEDLRGAIAAKKLQITQIERSPLPVQDALKRFDLWAERLATEAVDALDVARLADPSARDGGLRVPGSSAPQTLFGLVLLVSREAVRNTLAGQLGDLLADREALTDAERARRVEEAETQLKQAEAMEEVAVRSLEEAGIAVSRRADADPAIILLTGAALAKLAG